MLNDNYYGLGGRHMFLYTYDHLSIICLADMPPLQMSIRLQSHSEKF